ncbi:hypothetical protein MMC29_000189 [Sticta canariensis]|nr:hypothetical protein [Sticta canariensis]
MPSPALANVFTCIRVASPQSPDCWQAMGLLAAACSPALQQAVRDMRNQALISKFPSLASIIAADSAQMGAASLWFWPHTRLAWVAQHHRTLLRATHSTMLVLLCCAMAAVAQKYCTRTLGITGGSPFKDLP